MKYFLIAGEASGDLHGSYLTRYIKEFDTSAQLQGWGGNLMQAEGVVLHKHIQELAFMGFAEVIKNLPTIMGNFKLCKQQITTFQPDIVVFIDYPGFNLRLAEWVKQQHYTTAYFISPQIWAWKEKRVYKIKQYIDKMLCILPFEQAFYAKYDYKATYVGHPLTHIVDESLKIPSTLAKTKPIVALLPGSRKQEVMSKLPIMLSVLPHFPDYEFIVAQSPSLSEEVYMPIIASAPIRLVQNATYDILKIADIALVTSGTATLETALFHVPQIVCYKGNSISVWLARRLIQLKYISLVNILVDKPLVKELIQEDLNTQNLVTEMKAILAGKNKIIQEGYSTIRSILGQTNAAQSAARIIAQLSGVTPAQS